MLGSTADIDFMLQDAGVPVIIGDVSAYGIFDESAVVESQDGFQIQTRATTLLVRTGVFPALKNGADVNLSGRLYTVKNHEPIDDGELTQLQIGRTST